MTKGIHHITAIASSARDAITFYAHLLGLRLVKKTVNQDDTETYHLFFGDRLGHPGMDLTFFIFHPASQGKRGNGLVTNISLAIPETSLHFWKKHLLDIKHKESTRFNRTRLHLFDKDDQQLELVAIPESELDSGADVWETRDVSRDNAIRNFHSATLTVESISTIEPVLTSVLGYTRIASEEHNHVFRVPNSTRAEYLEVSEEPAFPMGINAAGTVHHIAYRAKDEDEQLIMRNRVIELGLYPTEVIDRFYFKSVYFRTPAGILFEIATDGPGFTADETQEELGKKLALPPFLEQQRTSIESKLPPIS